jgi:hypothetical protein
MFVAAVALIAVMLCLLATTAHASITLNHCLRGRAADKALATFIPGWSDTGDRSGKARKEMIRWCDGQVCADGMYSLLQDDPVMQHCCEARLFFEQEDMHRKRKRPTMAMQAWIRPPFVFFKMSPNGALVDSPQLPWFSLISHMIFPKLKYENGDTTVHKLRAVPIAILVEEPDEGKPIFIDPKLNNGNCWEKTVQEYFGRSKECGDIAVRLIQQHEVPTPETKEERAVVIIDVTAAVNS